MDIRAFFASLAVVFVVCRGCTVLEPTARYANSSENDENKVYYSEIVVFGRVGEALTGSYPYSNIPGVFTMTFDVLCTFKGAQHIKSMKTIIIAGLGNENKQIAGCPNASVSTNDEVIMFLKSTKQQNVFEVEFAPGKGAIQVIVDDLTTVCGIEEDTSSEHPCATYAPTGPDECRMYKPPVPRPPDDVHTLVASTPNPPDHEVTTKNITDSMNQQTVKEVHAGKMVSEEVASSSTRSMGNSTTNMPTKLASTRNHLDRNNTPKVTTVMTQQSVVETKIKDDKTVNEEVAISKTGNVGDSKNKSCPISIISLLLFCFTTLLALLV